MLYPCSCNVVISCWKSGAYGIVICRGGTDMCFIPGSGWKHLDLEQYRILGLRTSVVPRGDYTHIVQPTFPPGSEPGEQRKEDGFGSRLRQSDIVLWWRTPNEVQTPNKG